MTLKLKWEPEVYLLSRPVVDEKNLDSFLASHGVSWESDAESHGDLLPEVAGRLCYMSYQKPRPGGNKAYLEHIKEVGHGSVLEHTNFSFILAGISRSLTHELVRHRAGMAYSQLSQRYVDESDCAFVVPWELQPVVREYQFYPWPSSYTPDTHELPFRIALAHQWFVSCQTALTAYSALTKMLEEQYLAVAPSRFSDGTERRKTARQTARSVLPNCTETKIFVTGNVRAWRHMLEQRGSRYAEVEIRRLAVTVFHKLREEAPNLFADYFLTSLPDGTWEINTAYRKV